MDHPLHTVYSRPGPYSSLLEPLPTVPAELSAVSRNVIVHYRALGRVLPEATRPEINSRWIEACARGRSGTAPIAIGCATEITTRVQGCCRDHTLFCLAALREHDVPARSRCGLRWLLRRRMASRSRHRGGVDRRALATIRFRGRVLAPWPRAADGSLLRRRPAAAGFVTAASAWLAYRRGELDVSNHGVDPSMPLFSGAPLRVRRGDLRDRSPFRRRVAAVGLVGTDRHARLRGERRGCDVVGRYRVNDRSPRTRAISTSSDAFWTDIATMPACTQEAR